MLIVLLPLFLAALLSQLRPPVAIALAAAVVVLYVETAVALFAYILYWLDILHVAGAMIFASLGVVAYRVVGEAAQKRAVTNAFGLHVSPGVVKEILNQEGGVASALAGKRAKTTIFYSDIRGFTAMSERMTAEAVYEQLNEYFEAMCDVIFKYNGYVDKFIGDCIMAIFSAPNQTPDDARKAVEAALDQQDVIQHLGRKWQDEGKQPLAVGMGINTGYVVMGNLGSQKRMNYTVIGDDVNVAARLYNVALGGQIIVSESTYEEVKEFFLFRERNPVSVKGKAAPLRTFEVLGRKTDAEPHRAGRCGGCARAGERMNVLAAAQQIGIVAFTGEALDAIPLLEPHGLALSPSPVAGKVNVYLHDRGDVLAVCDNEGLALTLLRRPLMAAELITAVKSAARMASLERAADATEELLDVGRALGAERDLLTLQNLILNKARRLTNADAGSLLLLEEIDGDAILRFAVAQTGPNDSGTHVGAKLPLAGTSIVGTVALSGASLCIPDAYAIPEDAGYGFD